MQYSRPPIIAQTTEISKRKIIKHEDRIKNYGNRIIKLQQELHSWKKHYLKVHMEFMESLQKTEKVDLTINKSNTPVMDNIPPTKVVNRVRPLQ